MSALAIKISLHIRDLLHGGFTLRENDLIPMIVRKEDY